MKGDIFNKWADKPDRPDEIEQGGHNHFATNFFENLEAGSYFNESISF